MMWPLFTLTLFMWALTARMFWSGGYEIASLACAVAGAGYLLIGIFYAVGCGQG